MLTREMWCWRRGKIEQKIERKVDREAERLSLTVLLFQIICFSFLPLFNTSAEDISDSAATLGSKMAAAEVSLKNKKLGVNKLLQPLDFYTLPGNVKKATTRKELFALLINKGLDIKIIKKNVVDATEARKLFKVEYLPQLKLSSGYSIHETITENSTYLQRSTDLGLDLTGQYYGGISYGLTLPKVNRVYSITSGDGSEYASTSYNWELAANVGVKLLSGSFFFVGFNPKRREEINNTVAIENIKSNVLNIINNAQSMFIDVFLKQTQLRIRELALVSAKVLLSDQMEMYKVGEGEELSILKAKLQVMQNESSVISAERDYADSQANLRKLLNIKDAGELIYPDPLEISKIPKKPTLKLAESVQLAQENRSEYKKAALEIKTTKMDIEDAFSNTLPGLDLTASRKYDSNGMTFTDSGRDARKLKRPETTIGVTFSYIFTEDDKSFSYRLAKRNYSQAQILLQQAENLLEKEVSTAIHNINMSYKKLEITKIARDLSEKKLQNEYIKFRTGSGKIRDVIDSQTEVNDSRIAEIDAQIEVLNTLNAYDTAVGRLPPEVEFGDFL
ncbi:MAG: TolC family protein [Oligoflexia bacterium]|nr:TolC family protein [Oligoflexia bacterium]